MKDNKYIIISSLVAILLLYTLSMRGTVGLFKSRIEGDARKRQKIDNAWLCAKDITDEMGALLFYDNEVNHNTFSIYLNNDGFSYGYFFREGGSLGFANVGIQGFSYQEKGMALISMNEKNINKIQLNNGQNVETIILDPQEPFAIIIPPSIGEVTLYNSSGESISIDNISVY